MGAHRRSELEIICDILETCLEGAAKTSIVYKANLNFTRLNKYINTLLGMGYISLTVACVKGNEGGMKIVYATTEQGKLFLTNFVDMQRSLEELTDRNKASVEQLITRFL